MIASDRITIQSMTTMPPSDADGSTGQILRLEKAGCDIVRVAVPDMESAEAISEIKERINIPIVADIHFDYRLALRSIERGADKIRINPGNIADKEKVKAIAKACRDKGIPIRIGVNSGSLEKTMIDKYGGVTAEAMVESALGHIRLLNEFDFDDIWISAKTSNVKLTVETYRLLHMSAKNQKGIPYPLHIGITEAGTEYNGIIKNAIGIGALLLDGIGNTVRVSLTAEPEREVIAAKAILKALGLRGGIDIISCPVCGRCKIDLKKIAQQAEKALSVYDNTQTLTVAVMGCAVNGPGEASHADYGIAGGDGEGIIFASGKIIRKVPENQLVSQLMAEISGQSGS